VDCARENASTVWRQVATDTCQAVDCARENASTVWRQVATDTDRSRPLPSGGLR
jgi:hypothetical protein